MKFITAIAATCLLLGATESIAQIYSEPAVAVTVPSNSSYGPSTQTIIVPASQAYQPGYSDQRPAYAVTQSQSYGPGAVSYVPIEQAGSNQYTNQQPALAVLVNSGYGPSRLVVAPTSAVYGSSQADLNRTYGANNSGGQSYSYPPNRIDFRTIPKNYVSLYEPKSNPIDNCVRLYKLIDVKTVPNNRMPLCSVYQSGKVSPLLMRELLFQQQKKHGATNEHLIGRSLYNCAQSVHSRGLPQYVFFAKYFNRYFSCILSRI